MITRTDSGRRSVLFALRKRTQTNTDLLELGRTRFTRRVRQEIACGLRLRESNDIANTVRPGHQHYESIETECDTAVRRATVLHGRQKKTELLCGLFGFDA